MRKKEIKEEVKIEETAPKEKKIVQVKEVPEFYIMKIGETLKDVAKKYELDEKKLEELNGEVFGTNQIKLK